MLPINVRDTAIPERLAEQAGMAPHAILGLAVLAATDKREGTPDRLVWLAGLFEAYAFLAARDGMTHRSPDISRVATLLREEAAAHV